MADATSHFRLRDVRVAYGERIALAVERLDVARGEAVAFVGPSGAGKTTLLRTLCAAIRPTTGTVEVAGRSLSALSAAELRRMRAGVGFVHQDLSLVPNVRVVQNVLSGKLGERSLAGSIRAFVAPAKHDVERAFAILERVGIPEKLFERTDRLSGGQRQRVAIARALFQEPMALLADEPVSSVDPARARATVSLLSEISREQGLTLCMSLHNLELAREFFPRLVGLRRGGVVFDRATGELDAEEFHSLYRLADREELLADA